MKHTWIWIWIWIWNHCWGSFTFVFSMTFYQTHRQIVKKMVKNSSNTKRQQKKNIRKVNKANAPRICWCRMRLTNGITWYSPRHTSASIGRSIWWYSLRRVQFHYDYCRWIASDFRDSSFLGPTSTVGYSFWKIPFRDVLQAAETIEGTQHWTYICWRWEYQQVIISGTYVNR